MHIDPVGAWAGVAAIAATSVTVASPMLDPIVLVAAVGALGAVGTTLINAKVSRHAATLLTLRDDLATAQQRAVVAEQRAQDAASRLTNLDAKFHEVMKRFTRLEIWSIRVVDEMNRKGLQPPPIPE